MNHQIRNFLILLCKVTDKKQFPGLISPVDWAEIFALAKAHNVYGLVYDMACEYPEFSGIAERQTYTVKAMRQIAAQTRRTAAFLELYQAFLAAGLRPIVMKGIICRQLYGECGDHRPSGDEDLLIRKADYRLAEMVLKEQGYFPEHTEVTAELLEELQEVGFRNKKTGLYIELHVNPMGHENRLRYQMNSCFQEVFDSYREVDIDGVTIRTMKHTDHFLYLVLHAFRHFTAGGLGIRQVMDILLYENAYGKEIDWDDITRKLNDFDAFLFLSDIIHIGNRYLGFCLPILAEPNCPKDMLIDLISSGVFGNETQAQRTAYQMTMAAVSGREKAKGSVMTMLRTLFPGRARMLNLHPELLKKPWLLPVCWVKRGWRFLQHDRRNGGNLAKESMEISWRRIRLLKKYKII